jgi:hypothetical protein
MRLDDIRLRIEMNIPDVFEQHCARRDAAFVAHQISQQLAFARLQIDRRAGAPYGPRDQAAAHWQRPSTWRAGSERREPFGL